jgi:acyl-CoA thioester hydrolase
MIQHETKLRVRDGETDQMGYLYYGNYAQYYEIGRVEALRSLGVIYSELEKKHGIMLPVYEVHSKFISPAYYDQEIRQLTEIRSMPTAKIQFFHQLYNPNDDLIHVGEVTLVFFKAQTKRPIKMPSFIENALSPYFE